MGYLFENMEKVDIQAVRRKAKKAQKKRIAAEKKAEDAERKAIDAEHKAIDAEHKAIATVISLCKELGGTKELAINKLQTQYGLDPSAAREKVAAQWNAEVTVGCIQNEMEIV